MKRGRQANNTAVCDGCGAVIPSREPRVVVVYRLDTYDPGRLLERFCLKCRPAERPQDQRLRQR